VFFFFLTDFDYQQHTINNMQDQAIKS